MRQVFTIGHSSQSIEEFIASLQRHAVEVVADVRSRPYSRRFPHFSREPLQANLKAASLLEEHQQAEQRLVAEELGASEQPELFAPAEDARQRLEQAYTRRARAIAYHLP
jgi:hypothetical protein